MGRRLNGDISFEVKKRPLFVAHSTYSQTFSVLRLQARQIVRVFGFARGAEAISRSVVRFPSRKACSISILLDHGSISEWSSSSELIKHSKLELLQAHRKENLDTMKIVIVGGVAGGASAAARARRLCEKAEIVLLQRDKDVSYASCGTWLSP